MLRELLTDLEKREAHVQKKIKTALAEAKAKVTAKNKKGALVALKRKQTYESQLNEINGARMTLESQVMALEGQNINLQTFQAMQTGAMAMKRAKDLVTENIQEEMEMADQIGKAMARPADSLFEDDELMEELNMMEEQEAKEQMLPAASVPARWQERAVLPPQEVAVASG